MLIVQNLSYYKIEVEVMHVIKDIKNHIFSHINFNLDLEIKI